MQKPQCRIEWAIEVLEYQRFSMYSVDRYMFSAVQGFMARLFEMAERQPQTI